MDACLLNVLHDPAYVHVFPVRDGVYVNLGVILHKLVDEGRGPLARARASPEVKVEILVVVDDLHPPSAEYVGWPHDDRVAELARDLAGLLGGGCRPEPWMRDAELSEQPAESGTVFREVYSVWGGAEDASPRYLQFVREL